MVALEHRHMQKDILFLLQRLCHQKRIHRARRDNHFLRAMFNLDKVFLLRLIAFLLKTTDIICIRMSKPLAGA